MVYSLDRPTLPSGYRDHELAVGVDRVAQAGALTLADDENFVSKGSMDRGIGEYMLLGHVREFMAGSEVPIELVRRAVKEFLGGGGRIPTCIEWQEEEF
ncbi:Imm1 family immunity protein [Streptomyces sp. NPDC001070]